MIPGFLVFAALLASNVHPGPSVWGDMVLEKTGLDFKVEGAADPLTTCIGAPFLMLGPIEPEERKAIEARVAEYFAGVQLEFDGKRVAPEVLEVHIQDAPAETRERDASWMSSFIRLHYPLDDFPRQFAITWTDFKGEGFTFMPIVIKKTSAGIPKQFTLFPDEPQYIWHDDASLVKRAGEVKKVRTAVRGTLDVPLPSLGIVLAALALLLFARKLRMPRVGSQVAFVALLVAAVLLRREGHAAVPWPFAQKAALPAPEQARTLFESLHRNIYSAFDAEGESAIYDLLATSVDASLLDPLYGEVYESLILREQGGAVCGIDSVKVLDGAVVPESMVDAEHPEFKVDWHWEVVGSVSHWGHVHRRKNEYKAEYTVRHDGESWKIAGVVVKEQKRVDDFE